MRIREGSLADADAIARVQVDTWRTAYSGIVPAKHLAELSREQSAKRWRTGLADSNAILYIAENDDGKTVGFAIGGSERDNDAVYQGEIYAIYVLKAYQQQGLGRQLVASIAQRLLADGVDSMLIWVLAKNPCRDFYKALGGRPVARKKIVIGETILDNVGYGWRSIQPLVTNGKRTIGFKPDAG